MEYEDECKWLGGIPSKGFCKIKIAFLEDAGVDCEKNLQGKTDYAFCTFNLKNISKLKDDKRRDIRHNYYIFKSNLANEFRQDNRTGITSSAFSQGSHTIYVSCPKCGKEVTIYTWYYPGTRRDPPDGGFEIEWDKSECKCDEGMTHSEYRKFEQKIFDIMRGEDKETQKALKKEWEDTCEVHGIPP